MLRKEQELRRNVVEFLTIEDCVPRDHLLRKIDGAIDFGHLYDFVDLKGLYGEKRGRPSVDPVVLFKIVLIQHLYGIPSLRRTLAEIDMNMAYRWFFGYSLNDELPYFSAEVNADREAHGKKPFDDDNDDPPKGTKRRDNTSRKKLARRKKAEKARKMVTVSTTDPDSGIFHNVV